MTMGSSVGWHNYSLRHESRHETKTMQDMYIKNWQTSNTKILKTPKYKRKFRNREILSTTLLKNKAETSLIKQYHLHIHYIIISQTAAKYITPALQLTEDQNKMDINTR